MENVDPKLARDAVSVLDVLISIEPANRARVLDAVTKLVNLTSPSKITLAASPEKARRPRCSKCNRVGHNARSCPDARRCSRCNSTGHDRRNCPDLETPP